jgi:plasmid stability protein
MATLTIRNVPAELREQLRIRAARHGRSMEAEVRALLARSVWEENDSQGKEDVRDFVRDLYSGRTPQNAAEELIRQRRMEAERE